MREYAARTGERLSLTAYIVACLARAVAEHPAFNARRRAGRLYLLDDVTVSVLVERTIDGQPVPDMLAVHAADTKPYRQIQAEIRAAQRPRTAPLGSLSGMDRLLRLIPPALFTPSRRCLPSSASRPSSSRRRIATWSARSPRMSGCASRRPRWRSWKSATGWRAISTTRSRSRSIA